MPLPNSSSKKVANNLVAMSSAAILAVYSAGYNRTRAAARRLEQQSEARIQAPAAMVKRAPPGAGARPAAKVAEGTLIPRVAAPQPAPKPAATSAPVDLPAPPPTPAPQATPAAVDPLPAAAVAVAAPPAPPPIPAAPAAPPASKWKDGTYLGWGSCRHGDIQASVKIEKGQIISATIAQCLTRYSCSVIDRLPPEVPQRQSPDVDYVSGATQSANAFYSAVVDALTKATEAMSNAK